VTSGGLPEIRILALGDSYTIGEAVDARERWPARLAARLRSHGVRVADPEIVARTGWTTDELSAGIHAASPRGPFDVVTLLIGVNNQYRGRPLDEYRQQFQRLLALAVQFAGSAPDRVIVVSIPDWSVTPFAGERDRARIAAEIDAFNAVNRGEAGLAGVRYVDVTAISRRAAREPDLVAPDGLHPSGRMYEEWADVISPAALDALDGR